MHAISNSYQQNPSNQQYQLHREIDFRDEPTSISRFYRARSIQGSTNSSTLENDSNTDDHRSIGKSWLNSGHMTSIPWGAQAQNRKGGRSTTPGFEHDSAATTTIASSNSTTSLDKQVAQDLPPVSQALQRLGTSCALEIPGAKQNQELRRSTDSLDLYDSPLIIPVKFPTPPEKPAYMLEQYKASQVTPPSVRPVTPEPIEPRTPTLVSPATGRFKSSNKSYPSPIQAGLRSPSSRYSVETSARREISGSSFQAARAINFDVDQIPISSTHSPGERPRTDSFGAPGNAEWHHSTSTRTPEISDVALLNHNGNISYGFDILKSPIPETSEIAHNGGAAQGRFSYGLPSTETKFAYSPHVDPSNDTPNLSISGLVSSPPSVDTGVDYNTVYTSIVTPEDRHFPNISSPPSAGENGWASPGIVGWGEGIAGGPQRDDRGKRIDSRRWRVADPMLLRKPRTATDVYTNGNSGKHKTGFKEKFSQSVLNLLGETKKSKRKQGEQHPGAETPQWPRKMPNKEKRKSVTDLLGPSVPRSTYEWNHPPPPTQMETPAGEARRFYLKRSESSPLNLFENDVDQGNPHEGPASATLLNRRQRSSNQYTSHMARAFPQSPSMPALSASLQGSNSPDLRIQSWLNASQAALLDTETGRYDFGRLGVQEQPRTNPTPLKPYSFSTTNLSRVSQWNYKDRTEATAPMADFPVRKPGLASDGSRLDGSVSVREPLSASPVALPHSARVPHYEKAKRRSIISPGVNVNDAAQVTPSEKANKKRTSSISKLTSWLGLGRSSSKKAPDLFNLPVEAGAAVVGPSPTIQQNGQHSIYPSELAGYTRKTSSFANLHSMLTSTRDEDSQKKSRRRSGGDWFGSASRRSEKDSQSIDQRKLNIVLLSAEHLPPPTINAQGFLQSSAPFSDYTSRSAIAPSMSFRPFHQSQDCAREDSSTTDPAFVAPQMERDLSRLTEGDEEDTGRQENLTLLTATSVAVPDGRSHRKPLPDAFSEPLATSPNSLPVPPFENSKRHSAKLNRGAKGLSIGSMSSLSTGITDGEDNGAVISAVLSSPVHMAIPLRSAPVVARGVSLDLDALTAEERRAVGFTAVTNNTAGIQKSLSQSPSRPEP